ncbi:MAG: hypothetical protein L3J06_07605 [Cyclobacteriaceae bacterium]|nr:hypothetical protein [Cyclobacteriaceae bacterium]
MSFKPTNEQLIDYVYGNLSEAERLQIEQAIKENTSVRAEVEALNGSRSFLHNLEDEEVLEPERLIWELTAKQKKARLIWPILAVAASLILLLVVGYATQIRISYGGFELAFSNAGSIEESGRLTNEQVQEMISKSIVTSNIDFVAQLDETKSEIKTQMAINNKLQLKDMKRIAANSKELPKAQVDAYLAQLSDANRAIINDFFEVSSLQQQDYVNSILTDYFEYMDQKQKDDFRVLQANIEDVDYKNDMRTQETDQVIASILTTVGGGSMGQ